MTKIFSTLILSLLFLSGITAQSPVGIYKTIDDESGEAKSHVELYEKNGKIYGKIVKLLPSAEGTHCINCTGDKKGKPLVGLQILEDLEPYKDYWSYGSVLDPKSGKVYKASLWVEGKDKVKLRGYIGFSALGRTQTWYRLE